MSRFVLLTLAATLIAGCGAAAGSSTPNDELTQPDQPSALPGQGLEERELQLPQQPRSAQRVDERALHSGQRSDREHVLDLDLQ
jgi:hypothetical protein